jgi:hypothetical protein
MSGRLIKGVSLFLGVLMFMFGFLKFFEPFQGWFEIQINRVIYPRSQFSPASWGKSLSAACSYCHGFADR